MEGHSTPNKTSLKEPREKKSVKYKKIKIIQTVVKYSKACLKQD